MKRPFIPKHEPEVLAARGRQMAATNEIPADTTIASTSMFDVEMICEQRQYSAFHIMILALEEMPEDLRWYMIKIQCLGGHYGPYEIEFNEFVTEDEMNKCVRVFEGVMLDIYAMHAGITAVVDGSVQMHVVTSMSSD